MSKMRITGKHKGVSAIPFATEFKGKIVTLISKFEGQLTGKNVYTCEWYDGYELYRFNFLEGEVEPAGEDSFINLWE